MMKKATFFFLVIATLATTFYSCKTNTDDLWDSIHQLDERVTSLEELCKQMNGNISSLQKLVQALQDNNSITMVTPVKQGEKTIGYTISFTKGEPITIYHGKKEIRGNKEIKEIQVIMVKTVLLLLLVLNNMLMAYITGR